MITINHNARTATIIIHAVCKKKIIMKILYLSPIFREIDRMKRLRLSGFFVHHSFVLIELVSGKHVFHEGLFSKPSNN